MICKSEFELVYHIFHVSILFLFLLYFIMRLFFTSKVIFFFSIVQENANLKIVCGKNERVLDRDAFVNEIVSIFNDIL